MDGLADLTIVIPTYGRPDYVRRQVDFWTGSPARIVIADGSPSPLSFAPKSVSTNITYIHSDGDFHSRMLRLADEVSTKFVAVLGDDDFFSPDGLRACINRLGADPTLIGCVGRSIRFFFKDGRVLAEQRDPESTEFPSSVKSGLDRLYATYHPGKIGALFYGVYRTAQWVDVVKSAYSVRFRTGYIYDTVIRSLLTYRGSIGMVENLTWYCSSENPPIKTAPGMDRSIGFVDWLTSVESAEEVRRCKGLIVDNLVGLGSHSRQEVQDAVNFVFDQLLRRYEAKKFARMSMSSYTKTLLIRFSPRLVKRIGKRVMPRSLRKTLDWTVVDYDTLVEKLVRLGISVSAQDSGRIVRLVTAFHQ